MIVVIIGPTGIGKTTLSIELAKYLDTEIISGDSVQVYKHLNIGSAKVTEQERNGIPHHLIDIMEPTEDCSVALYQQLVRNKISEFQQRQITPLIVGGTGLYIKSVLYDYNFEHAKRDTEKETEYDSYSNDELYQILLQKDPKATQKIHKNNRKRVLQAILRSDKNKISDNTNKDVPLYDFVMIGLTMERKQLYDIINKRVDHMIEEGLIDEVRSLYDKGIRSNSVQAIGYKELYKYFDGTYTLDQAIDKIKQHSRNLAKKQFTFFRHQFDVNWITVDPNHFDEVVLKAKKLIEKEV
jgi:tRNA dimethylallyltransferase